MASNERQPACVLRGVFGPTIARAYWGCEHAWHGGDDDLWLHIETRRVPDGTPVRVQLWEGEREERCLSDFVAELDATTTIRDNRSAIRCPPRYDPRLLGDELATNGDALHFYFIALIDRFRLRARSNPLLVDGDGAVRPG